MWTLDEAIARPWNKEFPRAVQIETVSLCNAKCTFCPYPTTSKIFPAAAMTDVLFDNILSEVATQQPLLIAPYLNNEPLLDQKIFRRMQALRMAVPQGFIDLSTNASRLNEKNAEQLLSPDINVNEIKLNFPSINKVEYEQLMGLNYEESLKNVREFIKLAERVRFKGRYRIIIVSSYTPNQDIDFWNAEGIEAKVYNKLSRGGAVTTAHEPKEKISGCKYNRETEWMHVLHNGLVVLCCMDWYRSAVLGDANKDSLKTIWQNPLYADVRRRVQTSSDKSFICNKCEWSQPVTVTDPGSKTITYSESFPGVK